MNIRSKMLAMHTTVTPKVEVSALLLDVIEPGWAEQIDLATLDMSLGQNCVLGQIYNSRALEDDYCLDGYSYATNHIFQDYRERVRLGFTNPSQSYELLQERWVEQILARRVEQILVRMVEEG